MSNIETTGHRPNRKGNTMAMRRVEFARKVSASAITMVQTHGLGMSPAKAVLYHMLTACHYAALSQFDAANESLALAERASALANANIEDAANDSE